MDTMSFVRFLIARANSSQPLSKFWRTTMQKMANGQAPAENSRLILQGCQFGGSSLSVAKEAKIL
jgi:hypothetical protein